MMICTIWRNERLVGSKQQHEKQGRRDLGTTIRCWNQEVAPNPVYFFTDVGKTEESMLIKTNKLVHYENRLIFFFSGAKPFCWIQTLKISNAFLNFY